MLAVNNQGNDHYYIQVTSIDIEHVSIYRGVKLA